MKPKICMVSPGILPIPAVRGGAIETLIQIFAEENEKEQEIELVILSVYDFFAEQASNNFKHTKFVYIKSYNIFEKITNFFIWSLNGVTKKILNGRVFFCTSYYFKCFQFIKRDRPDFIICEGHYQQFRYLLPYFKKEQIYLHLHGHVIPPLYAFSIFGGLIGVSQFVTREFVKPAQSPDIKTYTVMNCINDDIFKQRITQGEYNILRDKLVIDATDFIVMFCGRIVKVKGIRELIKAINQIDDKKIKLLIVGSPNFGQKVKTPFLSEIEKLIKKSKNKIIYTGYISQDELYKYYQIADILAVPSLWEEASCLVLHEGLFSGLPLLVTDSGGIPEVVSQDSAIFLKRDDNLINNLAMNIEYLYRDEERRKRMAVAAIKDSERFSRKKYYKELIEIFQ